MPSMHRFTSLPHLFPLLDTSLYHLLWSAKELGSALLNHGYLDYR